eukprot:1088595-Heterocapsa_arctica.AAC.1
MDLSSPPADVEDEGGQGDGDDDEDDHDEDDDEGDERRARDPGTSSGATRMPPSTSANLPPASYTQLRRQWEDAAGHWPARAGAS